MRHTHTHACARAQTSARYKKLSAPTSPTQTPRAVPSSILFPLSLVPLTHARRGSSLHHTRARALMLTHVSSSRTESRRLPSSRPRGASRSSGHPTPTTTRTKTGQTGAGSTGRTLSTTKTTTTTTTTKMKAAAPTKREPVEVAVGTPPQRRCRRRLGPQPTPLTPPLTHLARLRPQWPPPTARWLRTWVYPRASPSG